MARLDDQEITTRVEALGGWARQGDAIVKTYKLPSFPGAVAFVTHVAFLAEAADHHPDIDIRFNKVTLTLSTHSAGGITEKDFALAEQADELMG
jgi:4a-hydroxytetrahydrobiopterin dehydratase